MQEKHPGFARILSSYSREEAIEDGFLFHSGVEGGREIFLTANLIASLGKEELAQAVVGGMENAWLDAVKKFQVGNKKMLVHYDDNAITIMLPEDY